MRIERIFTPCVLATRRSAAIAEAVETMRRYQVGALLVMEDDDARKPVGIVTDRDLALNPAPRTSTPVALVMTPVIATVRHDADAHEALEIMRAHGVRRLIVTREGGAVCGIVSIDDIVDGLSVDLAAAAAVLKGDVRRDSAGLGEVKVGG